MTRRKGEITARMNERLFTHIVEVPMPAGGFGNQLDAIHSFHRDRGISIRNGTPQRRNDQEFVRWCFATREDADAFAEQFNGKRL
jgi:hypothetical protein